MARGQARILLVDDEQAVQTLLTYPLRKEGYEVVSAEDGQEALDRFSEQRFDLVVLDIMLPGMNGLEVCRRLRARTSIPVLLLTALGSEGDRVAGLEQGADDYLTKPFSPRELVLRVRAVLRRVGGVAGARSTGVLHDGDLRLDRGARKVTLGPQDLDLTTREFDLLAFLMDNPGLVHDRKTLLAQVWGWDFGDQSTVTVHVRRLRAKIEHDAADPRRILTVWGSGYRYQPLVPV